MLDSGMGRRSIDTLKNLGDSMPNRLLACIEARGGYNSY